MTEEIVSAVPISEEFVPMELYALARFGRWDELMAAPKPRQDWRYTTGVWHFGQGMAKAATGDSEGAKQQLAEVREIASHQDLKEMFFASGSTPSALLTIAGNVLEARIASESGDHETAIALLEHAVVQQDALPYTEPPPWYFPNREALGEALLMAERPAEAETVFVKQLEYTPRNGWSLYGLAQSQDAQGKTDAAAATRKQLDEVWARADFALPAAVF